MEQVFLMLKTRFTHGNSFQSGFYNEPHISAFDSFWAANRAMFDDWTVEYQDYIETEVMDENDEKWDPAKHDPDGFWAKQTRPFEDDWESELIFPGGDCIRWKLKKVDVEGLNKAWNDKPGYCPNPEDEQTPEDYVIHAARSLGIIMPRDLSCDGIYEGDVEIILHRANEAMKKNGVKAVAGHARIANRVIIFQGDKKWT